MGISAPSTMFLCAAKSHGVDFTSTAMIGRQTFNPDESSLRRAFKVLSITEDPREFLRKNPYSEEFFRLLGAKEISAVDYSAYEGAGIVHDMNLAIPDDLRQRFSHVHDGGTIEHVFNAPQAFQNCMEMVKVGGYFTQVNIANNCMGHGFWQFSPELLFRVFSPENGFEIQAILLHEVVPSGRWFVVSDPDVVRCRVRLCNSVPTYICTIARRISEAEIFSTTPIQSDYAKVWDNRSTPKTGSGADATSNGRPRSALQQAIKSRVLSPIKRALKSRGLTPNTYAGGYSKRYFRKIDEESLLRGRLTAAEQGA